MCLHHSMLALYSLVMVGAASAQPIDSRSQMIVTAGVGLHDSNMSWNVGFSRDSKLSELTFRGITIGGGHVGVLYRLWERGHQQWLLAVEAAAGRVVSGTIQDSDFTGGAEGSRSLSEATGNSASSETIALGWYGTVTKVPGLDGVSLWLGFERERRTIRIQNGVQVFPTAVPSDLLEGLDSRYSARWTGPWAAVDPTLQFERAELTGRLAVHFLTEYHGEGSWNLREEYIQPRSFVQKADGFGFQAGIRLHYQLTNSLIVIVRGGHTRYGAKWGDDFSFRVDGSEPRLTLREVRMGTSSLQFGLSRVF